MTLQHIVLFSFPSPLSTDDEARADGGSLVELPVKLSRETLKALEKTRISGVLINLQPDRAPDKNRRGGHGAPRRERKG